MVTATPETFLAVLRQVMDDAIREAERAPGQGADRLAQLLEQAGNDAQEVVDGITRLPGDVLDEVKRLLDPPDWWSLLVLLMTKVSELDPDHMTVGTLQPPGWVRLVTLTYTPGVEGVGVTLGLGLVKDGELTRGLLLRATEGAAHAFSSGPLSFTVGSIGGGDWALPFTGGVRPPTLPTPASLTVDVALDFWAGQPRPLDLLGGADVGTVSVGALVLHAVLQTATPLYTVTLGIGSGTGPEHAGLYVALQPPAALAGFPVTLALPTVAFTPSATLAQGTPPRFSLGQQAS